MSVSDAIEEAFRQSYRRGIELTYKELEKINMCGGPTMGGQMPYPGYGFGMGSMPYNVKPDAVETKSVKEEEVDPWRPKYKPIIDFEAEEKAQEVPVEVVGESKKDWIVCSAVSPDDLKPEKKPEQADLTMEGLKRARHMLRSQSNPDLMSQLSARPLTAEEANLTAQMSSEDYESLLNQMRNT